MILPIIAILAVTGEWSQRSGLTTFTLMPSRERVIGAKAIATLLVGLGAVSVAFAAGALGNVAGSARKWRSSMAPRTPPCAAPRSSSHTRGRRYPELISAFRIPPSRGGSAQQPRQP